MLSPEDGRCPWIFRSPSPGELSIDCYMLMTKRNYHKMDFVQRGNTKFCGLSPAFWHRNSLWDQENGYTRLIFDNINLAILQQYVEGTVAILWITKEEEMTSLLKPAWMKVETPIRDNDLILTPIIAPQSGWQWTWSCSKLHMGGFRDGGWQFLTFGRCH
jgi:hypothetical protein